jgi:hypothetical protein
MLDYSSLRNVFKATDRINSKHLVLAEWNMNKYQTIEKYGVYIPTPPLTASYSPTDGNISSGENYSLIKNIFLNCLLYSNPIGQIQGLF